MDLPTLDPKQLGKRVLELLGIEGSADVRLEKLRDGSIRIIKEGTSK